jgi:NTE family protein
MPAQHDAPPAGARSNYTRRMTARHAGTAFVLAGGGSLGAVQVGMLRALVAAGVAPDVIVGASAGAINACYFAGEPTADGVAELERIWRGLRRRDVFPVRWLQGGLGALGVRNHLVDPEPLRRLLEAHLPEAELARTRLACHVVATDLMSGEEVVVSDGPSVDAVLASAAIPGVFPPVERDGRFLIDGAIANNTPVTTAVALGAQRVIVLPTGWSCALTEPPASALGMALHAISLLISRQLRVDIERLHGSAEVRVVPPLCPIAVGPQDFRLTGAWIERAAASTRQWLDGGGLERAAVPAELGFHLHEALG